jgi:hypothetical protein
MPSADQGRRTKMRSSGKLKKVDSPIDDDEGAPIDSQEEPARRSVRLAVNVSDDTARTFRSLIERKGLSITEGIRRAIAVWRFVEDETERGNKLIVQEPNGTQREVLLL